jgi:hypothetical protein
MVGRISKFKFTNERLPKTYENSHFTIPKGNFRRLHVLSGLLIFIMIYSWDPLSRRIIKENKTINKSVIHN